MAIDPVKVPANVQVEEKIVGPVGLRQLFLLLAGGGVSYLIFTIMQESRASGTLQLFAWLPLVVAAAFAFVTVNDISLLKLIFLQIEKMDKPARRTFGPRRGITVNIRTAVEEVKETHSRNELPGAADLAALSSRLDTGPEEEEIEVSGTDMLSISASDGEGPSIDGLFEARSGEKDTEEEDDSDSPFIWDLRPPAGT
jgi:hypothetical protein